MSKNDKRTRSRAKRIAKAAAVPQEQARPGVASDWEQIVGAPRSSFFRGRTVDIAADKVGAQLCEESMFTQSNGRVLIGQSANGTFRMIAMPTAVYPVPTAPNPAGFRYEAGMYYRSDIAMYLGDLCYQIRVDGQDAVDLAADDRDNVTTYGYHWLPLTQTKVGDLELAIVSVAPVAADPTTAALTPCPLPGPAGAVYAMRIRNRGSHEVKGKVTLRAGDMLIGDYEDMDAKMRAMKKPAIDMRRGMLVLSRPDGAVGIRLARGQWTNTDGPFTAEISFELRPGEETVVETHVVIGASQAKLLPTMFELAQQTALQWIQQTAAFWQERLGQLDVSARNAGDGGEFSRDVYVRCILDNFNCIQMDEHGNVLSHWQGAPSHWYGVIWGIDIEPTATSIAPACPEVVRQVLLFFMTRSQAWGKRPQHSTPIYIAPVILARKYLELTADRDFFERRPDVMTNLDRIMAELMAMRSKKEPVFPTTYSSDGLVVRKYDYGTNVKVWYALESYAVLLRSLGRAKDAPRYVRAARELQSALRRLMWIDGPFGPQISGGVSLGESQGGPQVALGATQAEVGDPSKGRPYYDGEDTSSMLAPIYGCTDFDDELWVNYHRFARSIFCGEYDAEHRALRWFDFEGAPVDGTGYFSQIGGSVTRGEMIEALEILRRHSASDVTGSVHWWPAGVNRKNGLTRCSQGQGAWAWQYLQQWLGLHADCVTRTLTFAPRGLPTEIHWHGARIGQCRFDLDWVESPSGCELRIRNNNDKAWSLRAGLRTAAVNAAGPLSWRSRRLPSGVEIVLGYTASTAAEIDMDSHAIARIEARSMPGVEGVYFAKMGGQEHRYATGIWCESQFVRFLVINGTDEELHDAVVTFKYGGGWLAQERPAAAWQRFDDLRGESCKLEIGTIPAASRAVAAFRVKRVETSQAAAEDDVFEAELTARTGGGKNIRRVTKVVAVSGGR